MYCCKCNNKIEEGKQFLIRIARNHGCVECDICQKCAEEMVKWLNLVNQNQQV